MSAPDVILVGAGTAGCVLAERLTASGGRRVLLLEAGGPPTNRFVGVPAGFPRLFKTDHDWAFECEPQADLGGRRVFAPRGKMLGGCSNMNAMIHQWCHPADFDGWAAAGAAGWAWADVAAAFRDQETWRGDLDPARGTSGPLVAGPNRYVRPMSRDFVAAARAAGLGDMPAYNGRAFEGAWLAELAVKGGCRFSAYHACLVPAMRRPNLRVVTGAVADRLVFSGTKATGVVARVGGVERVFSAPEVVVCAGAYLSPLLLMRSGVGPAETLRRLGVRTLIDAPDVGENLQDHPVIPVVFRSRGRDTFKNADSPGSLLRYLVFGSGMLASNGVEAMAFTHVGGGPVPAPDLEVLFLPFDAREQYLAPPREHAFCLGPAVVAPRSRGRVSPRSADPLAPPVIEPRLLSDPEGFDAKVMWEGLRLCRRIAATAPLAGHNAGEIRPGDAVRGEADLRAYAAKEIQTVYHPCGTCRMGDDSRAVVDARLRVRGIDGLRVVDASVMPTVPRGHPHAVVAMIARRAAEWIEEGG